MKRLIFMLTTICWVLPAFTADLSKIKFEYITVDDGLSQGIVEDIMQDKQGFMWFATHDGLNRYDGKKFTVYRNDRNDPQSLASNWVFCLGEDKSGNIWIGSDGLNMYDPQLDKMTRFEPNPDNPEAYHGERVIHITIDTDSTIWLSTVSGLARYYPKKNKFRYYYHDPGNPKSLGGTTVFSTLLTKDNRLFIAPNTDQIYEYERSGDSFKEIPYKLAYQGNNNSKFMMEDPQGRLYITSEMSGVHIYNPGNGDIKLLEKAVGGINSNNIRTKSLYINPYEIWIGTDGGGINIFNPFTQTTQFLIVDTRNTYSLASNAIIKMFKDRDNNIWIGHYGAGISVWKRNREKFESYRHSPFNPESINKEVVSALFEDSKGRIWIGQDGGGLSLFDEATRSFEHIRMEAGKPGSLTSDVILAIHEDPAGNLLLGTYMGGLMVFDPDSRRVIKSYNSTNGMPNDLVWTIFKDSRERYWISAYRSGFSLYEPVAGTFENFSESGEGFTSCSNLILNIIEDPQGRIWFGTENQGICVLDFDKKETKRYQHDDKNKNSLSYNDVKSIVFIDDIAWIATNGGGLNRLDLKTDSFRVYTMNNGLTSNALMGLLKDKHNNLWISSTRGIMKFNPATGRVDAYDKSQGIQGNEFKFNSQFILSDGRMMFGGVNGLTIFHPDSIRSSTVKPNVVFTGFKIFDVSVAPGAKDSPLSRHINHTGKIKLKHKQSVFTIEFASLDYNAPEKNQFMYMMEGFDRDWVYAGNRDFVTYTNLDAGRYTFLLKGSNSDGVWNDEIRKISIRISPPWYKTKLAIVLFFASIVMLIIYYIRERERQSRRDNVVLQQKIDEAQAELKGKARKLEEQQEEIRRRDEEEADIRFLNTGIARLSEIIARKRRNLEELCTSLISELVRYIDASAGGIFVMDDTDPNHIVLTAAGDFCYSSDKSINYTFEAGEGNIGTCFVEKQTLKIDDLPDGYIVLRSGLGNVTLRYAIYVPVIQDNECVGVIEIASTEKLSDSRVGFVEKIAESLASIITIIKVNEKTSQILEQNNAQAEELRAQEEEMRQNLEELQATQEESHRREIQLQEELDSKNQLIEKMQAESGRSKKKK
ncbi:MAG: GAF domain-containing protein [Bacteroidales bacterium]|nr:GAF domain-containing protein [Bacteroidales bacterium]